MDILFKRGGDAQRSFTPKMGEPIFTVDTHELFIGDNQTRGGVPVGTVKTSGAVSEDMIATFKDTTGKVIQGESKSKFLNGKIDKSAISTDYNDNSQFQVSSAAAVHALYLWVKGELDKLR